MADMTATQPFQWPVRVYYEDTDAQGVVYYANYFRFMERARTEWLRALGVNQERMLNEDRRMFVVTRTELDFIVPARFNDELIVTARLSGLSRATFDIEQVINRAAFLNADTLKPQRVPASLFEENPS